MKHNEVIQSVIASIVSARKAKSITQTELGESLGLPQSYISRLESGRLDIRLSTALEIARYLGLELMMVPAQMSPIVNSIIGNESRLPAQSKPMYSLDDLEE
jgi:HTH-type transcriptional regulator / antitoxin HipB